jgi:hypothetical protein
MFDVSGWRKRQIALDEKPQIAINPEIIGYVAPQRKWVGLTDEEIEQGHKDSWVTKQAFESAVWWAEKKLKEKNES